VARLRERVLDLQRHFGLAGTDLEKILTSTDKIVSRGRRIESLDVDGAEAPLPAVVNGNGRLAG
jgi:DNA recombination protein RmuC